VFRVIGAERRPEISKNWVTIRRPGGFPGKINHVPLPP